MFFKTWRTQRDRKPATVRYQVSILRRAQKMLADLPGKDYQRVRDSIRNLAEEPRPRVALSYLVVQDGEFV